ncbi:TRAP transporter large permease [Oceanobacillus luteolus]|uniref:TRAP transporter large permease n=1 Tax=Oceanobacillus luteolus TaxID=1274358 RepID=A0ABW4HN12_9BACI
MEIIIALIILFVTLIIGVPVPFAFFVTVIFLIFTLGYDPSFLIPYGYSQLSNIVLLAVPLFILAGGLMSKGGIGERIIDFTEIFVGKIKGGLGVVAVLASALFGALSGSAAAVLTAIGSTLFPRLIKSGYPKGFAAALLANASVLGIFIPPSALMILFAWASNQSVLASFLATIIPGIILVIFLSVVNILYISKKGNQQQFDANEGEYLSFSKKFRSKGLSATPGLVLPLLVLGGIYGGIMTPTEAAAVAVIYAIPVGFWIYKGLNRKNFFETLIEAASTTGVIMIMLFGIMILSRIFITEGLSQTLTDLLLTITENKVLLLLMINVFLLFIGMIMDDVSAISLATPILLPIVINLGVDPIHFASIIAVNIGMGLLTPPTAPLLYLGSRVAKTPVNEMLGPTLLMIIFAWFPTLIITTFIPEISLFLPKLLLGY